MDQAAEPATEIAKSISIHQGQKNLQEFFKKVVVFLDKLDCVITEYLVVTLSEKIGGLLREGDRSEYDEAFRLLLRALNDRVSDDRKQQALAEALKQLPIDTAVQLVDALLHSQSVGIYQLQKAVDASVAKRIVSERLRREFVEPGADILASNPRPMYVLYQIGTYDQGSA